MEQKIIERVIKAFKSDLGQQCEELYTTPDGRFFIRYSEASEHCEMNDLEEKDIQIWWRTDFEAEGKL